eukprot:SAG31_NODE_366_length_16817_cov_17.317921_11_plen_72_part_00
MRAEDVAAFADFIADQQFHRPVDILAYYWFGKGSSQRAEAALQVCIPAFPMKCIYVHGLLCFALLCFALLS